jgi:hypothetical protein
MLSIAMNSICSITPTICSLLGVSPPAASEADALVEVVGSLGSPRSGAIDRCLIFSPDAIGSGLVRKYSSLFLRVGRHAPIEVGLQSVMPPKTPVCYASMFTGALPSVHGITEYVKRAPACETLFNVLVRTGLSTAIVAVKDSTMDTIFRQTGVDHFTETYDKAVLDRTRELIKADRHHLIVAYQQEYDDTLHREHPESAAAMEAVRRHVGSFVSLAAVVRRVWGGRRYLIAFSPDHGAHYDAAKGTGTHGDDVPEDMEVTHFFGLGPEI